MQHRVFLAEREGEAWRRLTYHEAHEAAQAIGQALLNRGLGPERPVLILSDNGIDHALMALGAMYVGVPAVPISIAYSLVSRDFAQAALGRGAGHAGPHLLPMTARATARRSLRSRDRARRSRFAQRAREAWTRPRSA